MKEKNPVWQGTLALMVLHTLEAMGPQHGFGLARRIEQISDELLAVNHGTLYPVLLKLEQEGSIASDWGTSDNNRKARYYRLTRTGRKQLAVERAHWEQTTGIMDFGVRILAPGSLGPGQISHVDEVQRDRFHETLLCPVTARTSSVSMTFSAFCGAS